MRIFRIHVEAGPYRPGSRVSGTVRLQDHVTHHVDFLNITFSGRCEVKLLQGTKLHTGNVQLFQYEQRLFTGSHILEGPCQWPFEFAFPKQCNTPSGLFSSKPSMTLDENLRQVLPQSFWYMSDNTNGFTGGLISSCVEYKLEATLATPQRTEGNLRTFEFLRLTRPRNEKNPEPRPHYMTHAFTVQNMYLLPDFQVRTPSLGERLKYKVGSNKLPKARCVLGALLPTVGVLGRPLPLGLGVSHDEHHSSVAATPAIFLRRVSVTLSATTTVRCASASVWSSGDIITQSTDYYLLAIKDLKHQNLQLIDSLDVGALMDLKVVERDDLESPHASLAPSFKTFNIGRKYALNMHVTVECAKEKFSREFISPNLKLLATECDPPVILPPLRAPSDERDGTDEEPLPTYETATKS